MMPDLPPPTAQEQAKARDGSAVALSRMAGGQPHDGFGERVMRPSTDEPARIRVVDDNEANRDLLVRRLQRQGHQMAMAQNGRIAAGIRAKTSYALVMLHIMASDSNSFEVFSNLSVHAAV